MPCGLFESSVDRYHYALTAHVSRYYLLLDSIAEMVRQDINTEWCVDLMLWKESLRL